MRTLDEFFTKHSLKKVDYVPIPIKNLDESNVGFIYHELMIGGEKLTVSKGFMKMPSCII